MSDSQQNAIELCDGILRSEGLPSYSELRTACDTISFDIDLEKFRKSPCYLCGYSGPGYFQPYQHQCAKQYHAARSNKVAKK